MGWGSAFQHSAFTAGECFKLNWDPAIQHPAFIVRKCSLNFHKIQSRPENNANLWYFLMFVLDH